MEHPRMYVTLRLGFSAKVGEAVYDSAGVIIFSGTRQEIYSLFGTKNIRRFIDPDRWSGADIQQYPKGWMHLSRENYAAAMQEPHKPNQRSKTMTEKSTTAISIKKPETALNRAQTEVGSIIEQIEAKIVDKEENYKGLVYDATTPEGYENCREVCKELRPLRADVEKTRKALKAPVTALGKKVDAGFKTLLQRMDKLLEAPHKAYRAEDERKEREEAERVEKAQNAMTWMRNLCNTAMQVDSAKIQDLITKLEEKEIDPELFQELLAEATSLKEQTLQSLKMALSLKQQAEENERKLAEMQKEASQSTREEEKQPEPSKQAESIKHADTATHRNDKEDANSYLAHPSNKKAPAVQAQGYSPLELWPSDMDRAENEALDEVCTKLEEAEEYIAFMSRQIGLKQGAA